LIVVQVKDNRLGHLRIANRNILSVLILQRHTYKIALAVASFTDEAVPCRFINLITPDLIDDDAAIGVYASASLRCELQAKFIHGSATVLGCWYLILSVAGIDDEITLIINR